MTWPRFALLAYFAILLVVIHQASAERGYPPLPTLDDGEALGLGVQRTMTLLATSTPQRKNKVRILIYGQSISAQDWWKALARDLHQRFPNAELEVVNLAIGGFFAQRLVRPAEHDVYPYYPDLLIFHVYGDERAYEQIIRSVRSRTTAEVLIQTDHVTGWSSFALDPERHEVARLDDQRNRVFLPALAEKYQCGLVDVRADWAAYLKACTLRPQDLLVDAVHLNDHGNHLLAALVGRYLVHRRRLPASSWSDLVRTIKVGKEIPWRGDTLTLPFEGNRVDVLSARIDPTAESVSVEVRVDGKPPSSLDGALAITRPQPGPRSRLALLRVDHVRPLLPENWTLQLLAVSDEGKRWRFRVEGTQTGEDGEGDSDKLFVSRSGRVKIEPQSWFRASRVEPGYTIRWSVTAIAQDTYRAPAVKDLTREAATTLVQGIRNGKHRITLRRLGAGDPMIRAIRVYRPPLQQPLAP